MQILLSHRLLSSAESHDMGCGPAAAPLASDGAGGVVAPPPVCTVLDPVALDRLRELDPRGENRLMERVVSAFESSIGKLLPQLLEAMETVHLPAIRHVSHTLKSSSASIGAVKLSQMCAEMESMARSDQSEGMRERILLLQAEVGVVRTALQRMLDVPTP